MSAKTDQFMSAGQDKTVRLWVGPALTVRPCYFTAHQRAVLDGLRLLGLTPHGISPRLSSPVGPLAAFPLWHCVPGPVYLSRLYLAARALAAGHPNEMTILVLLTGEPCWMHQLQRSRGCVPGLMCANIQEDAAAPGFGTCARTAATASCTAPPRLPWQGLTPVHSVGSTWNFL